ncbi:hypothetical protein QQM39_03900 [Streptomyces sp. DT2A-34]|nr:hypothetical protein [Streptomyces sp. DT2A-34]MDO0910032.1 hypothetical protein [Streptomyces sp. DT2A-34]
MAASHDQYRGWGDVVIFAACTAARIGQVSGCRVGDIDTAQWIWTVRRQTTPAPGGLTDNGTQGKRARKVPTVEEIRPLITQRILSADPNPDARLFTGPRGGRISTAVLRDAVHKITTAGAALSAHLSVLRAPRSLPSPIVVTR